jgi:hypothetical protein
MQGMVNLFRGIRLVSASQIQLMVYLLLCNHWGRP